MQPRIRIKSELPVGKKNHPGSTHTKFYRFDWLIQSIIYYWRIIGEGKGRRGLFTFLFWKRGLIRGMEAYLRGGLNRGFTLIIVWLNCRVTSAGKRCRFIKWVTQYRQHFTLSRFNMAWMARTFTTFQREGKSRHHYIIFPCNNLNQYQSKWVIFSGKFV